MENFMAKLIGDEFGMTPLQMCFRILLIFIAALLLIRVSGRRSFGMNMPLDNVVTILLGGILSRGIDGKSSFFGVILTAFVFVTLYRLLNWACVHVKWIGHIVKGEEKKIFSEGNLDKETMKKFMITEKDLQERLRINGHMDSLEEVETVYLERDGEISMIKKEK